MERNKIYFYNGAYIILFIISLTCLQKSPFVVGSLPLQLNPRVGFGENEDREQESIIRTGRLTRAIIPSHYELEIRPILDSGDETAFTAPGKVRIHVKCEESTNTIELHSVNTIIQETGVTVEPVSGAPLIITGHDYNGTRQSYIITLEENLQVGQEYIIEIPFVAAVSDGLVGLYRSKYTADDGSERFLAATQFQETDARKMFPCFDEPSMKATFDFKIGRLETGGYHTRFCTEQIAEPTPIEGLPGWVWDEYPRTLLMPTYLLAILVSDFTPEVAPEHLYSKPVRTWGPPPMMAQEDSGKFSAQVAAKILNFFEGYLGIPYQMSKMDSVAVPDFAAGAMENWGLNLYRVPIMLFFKGESTQYEQWRQAAVISHELAHQWFGNLVTLNWWNDLWLNEGLCRYLQFIGVETTEPNLESMNRVVIDTIQLAMDFDAGATSVPIRRNETEIVEFPPSRIAYEKGASLIRMMNGFLTESTLIKGLQSYLNANAFGNVVQDQLFDELQRAAVEDDQFDQLPSGITVKDIMETWTSQTGFPVLRISRASGTRIFISQEKFLTAENSEMEPDALWYVPITYASQSDPDFSEANWTPRLWLSKTTILTSHVVQSTNEWIFVNPDARCYYRVLYDGHFTTLIKQQLDTEHEVFSQPSRSQLIDDYFKLAFANYIPITQALDFTTYLHNEDSLVVWTTVFNCLRQTNTLLRDTSAYNLFKEYLVSKINEPLRKIDGYQLEGENPITSMLREQLLDWACSMGHELCYEVSGELIRQWMANPNENPIAADIQPMIYCGAVANATDANIVEFIKSRHAANKSDRQNTLLLNSLGCSSSEDELKSFLELALDETSSLYGVALIQRVFANSIGHGFVYEFLSTRRTEIIAKHGENAISAVVSTASQYFSSEDRISELQEFKDANMDLPPDVTDSLDDSLNVIRKNKVWRDTHLAAIETWLNSEPPE